MLQSICRDADLYQIKLEFAYITKLAARLLYMTVLIEDDAGPNDFMNMIDALSCFICFGIV